MDLSRTNLESDTAEASAPAISRLVLIDDDLISREVLAMLALEAGFEVDAFESGESALAWLGLPGTRAPEAILTDLQMPGLSGAALAKALRLACPQGTPLVVMSGSPADAVATHAFDAFLLKPFSIDTLDRTFAAVLAELPLATSAPALAEQTESDVFTHLDRKTYMSLERSMSAENLSALLTMCLDDSDKRLGTMQHALAAGDGTAYTRAAHAIKGGCATVGFRVLASLAARMEQNGLKEVDDSSTPAEMIGEFTRSSAHLRGMLNTHGDRARSQSDTDGPAHPV